MADESTTDFALKLLSDRQDAQGRRLDHVEDLVELRGEEIDAIKTASSSLTRDLGKFGVEVRLMTRSFEAARNAAYTVVAGVILAAVIIVLKFQGGT